MVHTLRNQSVGRADGVLDASVTLHWVRGKYLVEPGDGLAYERVTKSLPELLGRAELDPNLLYLCHGTTIAHASSIVREGPQVLGTSCTESGRRLAVPKFPRWLTRRQLAGTSLLVAILDLTVVVYFNVLLSRHPWSVPSPSSLLSFFQA
jgi:hypothetical protein